MNQNQNARYSENPKITEMPTRGRFMGIAQRVLAGDSTRVLALFQATASGTCKGASGSPGIIFPLTDPGPTTHTVHVWRCQRFHLNQPLEFSGANSQFQGGYQVVYKYIYIFTYLHLYI